MIKRVNSQDQQFGEFATFDFFFVYKIYFFSSYLSACSLWCQPFLLSSFINPNYFSETALNIFNFFRFSNSYLISGFASKL